TPVSFPSPHQGDAKLAPEIANLLIGQQKRPEFDAFCTKQYDAKRAFLHDGELCVALPPPLCKINASMKRCRYTETTAGCLISAL
ncbi:MAG: hypothetical protein EA401_07700, partial [Planctomycetota bacterium]